MERVGIERQRRMCWAGVPRNIVCQPTAQMRHLWAFSVNANFFSGTDMYHMIKNHISVDATL